MVEAFKGSCLCGAVKFEADEVEPRAAHCHCSMCRKFHGAAYATIASVKREHFRWTAGEGSLARFTAANGTMRTFCEHCGSSLLFFSPRASADLIEVALAVFDDEPPVVPQAHIFVASGASWARPTDDLPCFTQGRASPPMQRD